MTDSQRQKVYDAEQAVRRSLDLARDGANKVTVANSTVNLPCEIRFGSLAGAQTYVDQVMATSWFRDTWIVCPVRVVQRRGSAKAHYINSTISRHDDPMVRGNAWAMREIVVLHELAHHVTYDEHGPMFCGAFLHLVTQVMGPEVGLLLTDALYSTGCKINHVRRNAA